MSIIKTQRFLKTHKWIGRYAGIFFSIFIIAYGLLHLANKKSVYTNYWGGVVFAHFVVGLGVLALLVSIYTVIKENKNTKKKK